MKGFIELELELLIKINLRTFGNYVSKTFETNLESYCEAKLYIVLVKSNSLYKDVLIDFLFKKLQPLRNRSKGE